ncbi:hypothetical protein FHG87_009218 [Trinorchestia longiramus]|nr:hypothetical protein FHG87_009218 [Trinorchestia longiramus]
MPCKCSHISQLALNGMDDVDACSSLCEKLMTLGEQESWQICSELAQHPRLIDLSAKTKLTNYALTYCPREQLPALLNLRHSVELEVVYEVAKSTIVREDLDRAEDVFLDAIESPIKDEEGAGNTIGSIVHEGRLLEATLGATHTVSAKATSLLGALGKASFWTSALSLVIPLRERAQDQSDDQEDNLDFTCQGCHAFYFDCCNLAHCSNIGYRYSDYSNPSLSNLSLRFSMALLKASLLEQIIAAGCGVVPSDVPNTKQDTTEKVVQELARSVLPQDTVFGLSLLFQLHPLQLAHDVLIALPTTDITIQVCQYYYALQIYSRLHPWTQPRLAPQYQHDPSVVIACAALVALKYKEVYNRRSAIFSSEKSKAAASAKLLPDDINKLEVDGIKIFTGVHEVDEKLTKLYEYFCSSEELLDDYVQGEALHRLDAGVDTVRFLNDPRYKEDTVLGLCMTTDPKMLDLAIVLAKKYKVSLWEVHMTQLQYMLSSDLATHQIAENMKARNAMHELKTKPELFVETLQAKVLTLIDGTDHKRLVLFFSLIREAVEQSEVASLVAMKATAEKHIDVLEQLMKLAPSLSYHHLLTRQMDTLSHLGTVVSDSNIKPLAALLLRVPSAAALVTCSSLYCAYAIKRFFTGAKEAKTTIAERQWVQRYEESVSLNWHELSAEDVLVLARALLLSEEAFQLVPLRARVSIAQIILDRARASNKQDDEHQQDWSATVTELNAWVTHLKSLHSPAFTALISGPDLALRHYAKMYATSDGSSAAATTVCNKALLGGCDLAVLRELREVMPEHAAPQPEDTLHSLIQRSLDALTEQGQQSDLLLPELLQCSSKNEQHTWWVERVQHLCSVLSCELQQENDLLMEELLMESARETALCENVALHHRLALFRAFFENLPASEEDKDLMLYLETRDVLACVDFPVTFASSTPTTPTVAAAGKEGDDSASSRVVEIGVSSVSTSEGRKELLEALMEAGNSPQRTRALLRLLQLWPSFSQEVYDSLTDNPWEILLTRLVGECDATGYGLPVNVIWETVNTALAKQQLPTSSLGHISLELLGVGMTAWPLAAKVALAKHNPRAIDAVLQNYSIAAHQVCSSDYDDEILQGFINRGLVPRLVGTPLYEPCTQYLIRTGDSNVVQGVLQQLQLSHPSHATALSQRVAVARPALTSITSAFKKVYSRLL